MKELTKEQLKEVNGGAVFLALIPAFAQGVGAGIAAGVGLLGLALGARALK